MKLSAPSALWHCRLLQLLLALMLLWVGTAQSLITCFQTVISYVSFPNAITVPSLLFLICLQAQKTAFYLFVLLWSLEVWELLQHKLLSFILAVTGIISAGLKPLLTVALMCPCVCTSSRCLSHHSLKQGCGLTGNLCGGGCCASCTSLGMGAAGIVAQEHYSLIKGHDESDAGCDFLVLSDDS